MRTVATFAAVTLLAAQFAGDATACDRAVVRHVRTSTYTAPVQTAVILREQQVVTVERPAELPRVIVTAEQTTAPAVSAGATLRVAGFFGQEKGSVFVTVGKVVAECKIVEWRPTRVSFSLPELGLLDNAAAVVEVARVDGQVAKRRAVTLTPRPDFEVLVHEPVIDQNPRPTETAAQVQTGGLVPASLNP